MIRNNNLNWDKVREMFNRAVTKEDVKNTWSIVDSYCYGREDVEELDNLTGEAYKRIDKNGEKNELR